MTEKEFWKNEVHKNYVDIITLHKQLNVIFITTVYFLLFLITLDYVIT